MWLQGPRGQPPPSPRSPLGGGTARHRPPQWPCAGAAAASPPRWSWAGRAAEGGTGGSRLLLASVPSATSTADPRPQAPPSPHCPAPRALSQPCLLWVPGEQRGLRPGSCSHPTCPCRAARSRSSESCAHRVSATAQGPPGSQQPASWWGPARQRPELGARPSVLSSPRPHPARPGQAGCPWALGGRCITSGPARAEWWGARATIQARPVPGTRPSRAISAPRALDLCPPAWVGAVMRGLMAVAS